MGIRYIQHDGLCGCSRCAAQAERDSPQPVWDSVEDSNYLDCGCHIYDRCTCALDFIFDDYEEG